MQSPHMNNPLLLESQKQGVGVWFVILVSNLQTDADEICYWRVSLQSCMVTSSRSLCSSVQHPRGQEGLQGL